MNLLVNGKPASITAEQPVSITSCSRRCRWNSEYVTVELNGDIMDRAQFDGDHVKDGDNVEILYFMGGGRP